MIGAGAAGLVTARELLREGHSVRVFEQSPHLGGVWHYTEEVEDDPLGVAPGRWGRARLLISRARLFVSMCSRRYAMRDEGDLRGSSVPAARESTAPPRCSVPAWYKQASSRCIRHDPPRKTDRIQNSTRNPPCAGRKRVHGSMYAELRTNLPREVMGFLDFPFDAHFPGSKDTRQFCSHAEVRCAAHSRSLERSSLPMR